MDWSGEWAGTGVETAWVEGFAGFFLWVQLGALVIVVLAFVVSLAGRESPIRRRRFWCALARRQVEVEFEERGVKSCSVFDPPEAIHCGRRCLDPSFRRPWDPALPLAAG